MRLRALVVPVLAIALCVSGCATKRYGRLQPLTAAEGQYYSCDAIEVEIAKIEAFRGQVSDGAQINGASVMGFLGDWGIGNASEKNAAERTATLRMNQLLALKAQKRCGSINTNSQSVAQETGSQQDLRQQKPGNPEAAAKVPKEKFGNSRVNCPTCRP